MSDGDDGETGGDALAGDGGDGGDAEVTPTGPMRDGSRSRVRSAALWGVAAALTFLVGAQGYLILGGSLPVRYAGLFALGGAVGVVAAVATYVTEHRLTAKRRV